MIAPKQAGLLVKPAHVHALFPLCRRAERFFCSILPAAQSQTGQAVTIWIFSPSLFLRPFRYFTALEIIP